ncbi:MAG TPA: hypothetical protein DCS43_02770 [Verrucomicrobia bacterium]|nr:hypothetical protein [Verrucomicrobiota bacterium]
MNRFMTLFVHAFLWCFGLALLVLAFRPQDAIEIGAMLAASRISMVLGGVALIVLAAGWAMTEKRKGRSGRYLSYRNEGGAVNISTEAIADYIAKLAPEFPSIVRLSPYVVPFFRRIDLIVEIRIKAGPQLHEICEVLQKRVRESMEGGLGIRDVRRVIVRVDEISIEHKTE